MIQRLDDLQKIIPEGDYMALTELTQIMYNKTTGNSYTDRRIPKLAVPVLDDYLSEIKKYIESRPMVMGTGATEGNSKDLKNLLALPFVANERTLHIPFFMEMFVKAKHGVLVPFFDQLKDRYYRTLLLSMLSKWQVSFTLYPHYARCTGPDQGTFQLTTPDTTYYMTSGIGGNMEHINWDRLDPDEYDGDRSSYSGSFPFPPSKVPILAALSMLY